MAKQHSKNIPKFVKLPDGSGFAIGSLPLPKDHWIYDQGADNPPMGLRCIEPALRKDMVEMVTSAGRHAVRGATMNGADSDFDPDALVQNLVVGLLGYFTADGLSHDPDVDFNPPVIPVPVAAIIRSETMECKTDSDGTPVLSGVYSGIGIKTDSGLYGIAERDGGVEVLLDGDMVYSSCAGGMPTGSDKPART